MNKIKIFKTNNHKMDKIDIVINSWAEENNVEILQIDMNNGREYSNNASKFNYTSELEIFIAVLYREKE
jgi:hypothetical protein